MESLIEVKQLPIIVERLQTLKARWEQMALDAEAMVCTEETIQAVKAFRAEMRKEFEELEEQRKQIKNAVMGPYEQFLSVYADCVSNAFKMADAIFARKISEVEDDMKRRCEDGLRDYFAELCTVHHLEWLEYERAGIRIDMASAKAKTPKKLREQLKEFVEGVRGSVDAIMKSEDAEIMAEYKRSLNISLALSAVQDRHQRIEAERQAQTERAAVVEREAEAVRKVEALAPPVPVEPEQVYKCTFTVRATKPQLRRLKEFLNMEGIQYE